MKGTLRRRGKGSLWGKIALLLSLWLVLVCGLSGVGVATVQAQMVYRVVDDQGNITFTDNPERGGEALTLAPLPSVSNATRLQGKPGQPFMPYDRFVIVKPEIGASLHSGMTSVEVDVSPLLREDHQIQLLVNGELSQSALHSDAFWLAGLASGQHRLQAELLDSRGRVQHRTEPVTIFIAE